MGTFRLVADPVVPQRTCFHFGRDVARQSQQAEDANTFTLSPPFGVARVGDERGGRANAKGQIVSVARASV